MSHTLTPPFASPPASRLPSGRTHIDVAAASHLMRWVFLRVATSHTKTCPPAPDEMSRWPSRSNSSRLISVVCPASSAISSPVLASHSRNSPATCHCCQSPVAVAMSEPSGEKRTAVTGSAWPISDCLSLRLSASHSLSVPSQQPERISLPARSKSSVLAAANLSFQALYLANSSPRASDQSRTVPSLPALATTALSGGNDSS